MGHGEPSFKKWALPLARADIRNLDHHKKVEQAARSYMKARSWILIAGEVSAEDLGVAFSEQARALAEGRADSLQSRRTNPRFVRALAQAMHAAKADVSR